MILALLPEILLVVLAVFVLTFDMLWRDPAAKRNLGWLTAGGAFLILAVSWLAARPVGEPQVLWGGMLRHDWLAFTFKSIGLVGLGVTALLSMDAPGLGKKGEYYILLLTSTIGICLMGASSDMIMLFLAIETTSIPLYVLAGFMKTDDRSTEAGFKYLLFGAATSSVMVYGFSLLFGFAGTTDLYRLAQGLASGELTQVGVVFSAVLVLVGFGFKISMAPFHFWAPDVYEGAPTPVTGFLSTASKAAGFAVLIRFMLAAFPLEIGMGGMDPMMSGLLIGACVATMTIGNTIALVQNNIKRLLAYSSIAHAGYVLLGVIAADAFGITSAVFYLVAYLLTNLAAFGVVTIVGRAVGSDEIGAYSGLSRRSSGLALVMLVAFLSLAGVPPLAGFIGKMWVFAAVVNQGLYVLAFIGVLNAIIGVYYYLIVLKVVYLYRSDDEDKPVLITRPDALALGLLTLGIILVGTFFAPWWGIADAAAAALFG
jgi:NADH-quinone oxidoreductase subunit N